MVELVAEANGPAGVRPIDLDGDGQDELIVNEFGERPDDAGPTEFSPGGLSTYWREGDGLVADDTVTWRREVIFDDQEGLYFPNDVTAEDLDGDGDGLLDIVTVGEEQEDAEVVWFRAVEPGVFEPDAIVIGSGGGSLPVAHDVDGDGDLDVGSAEYFYPGASYVWFENTTADPTEAWTHRPISEGIGSRPTEGVAFQAPPACSATATSTVMATWTSRCRATGTIGSSGSNRPRRERSPPTCWPPASVRPREVLWSTWTATGEPRSSSPAMRPASWWHSRKVRLRRPRGSIRSALTFDGGVSRLLPFGMVFRQAEHSWRGACHRCDVLGDKT